MEQLLVPRTDPAHSCYQLDADATVTARPDAEWMIWAKRLKDEHKDLLHHVEPAIQAIGKIASLEKLTQDLTASNGQLQQQNIDLQERVQQLYDVTATRHRTDKEELGRLKTRILLLERQLDDVRRDDGNLRKHFETRHEGQQKSIEMLRARVDKLRASVQVTYQSRSGTPASARGSEATTTDDSMQIHVNAGLDTQISSHKALSRAPQQNLTLEDYFQNGDKHITQLVQQYEKRVVKAFVTGLPSPYARSMLSERLDSEGWTWQNAKIEAKRLVQDGKARTKEKVRRTAR